MSGSPNTGPAPALTENANTGKFILPVYFNLADITAVVMWGFIPTFKGRIIATTWNQGKAVTTGSKLATLTPSINGTNLTAASGNGGEIALTSALCVAQTSTAGRIAGTAITGGNTFNGTTDYILLTASSVTAFAEGAGTFNFVLINDDTFNEMAHAQFGLRQVQA